MVDHEKSRIEPALSYGVGDNQPSFLDEALALEKDWFNAVESFLSEVEVERIRSRLTVERRYVLARVIKALLREHFIKAAEFPASDLLLIDLESNGCTLEVEGFRSSQILLLAECNRITANWRESGVSVPVNYPAHLLDLVSGEIAGTSRSAWQTLAQEISDSTLNEAWAWVRHSELNSKVEYSARETGHRSFFDWLQQTISTGKTELFLEQWSAVGHPLHIVPKAHLGVDPSTAHAMFPEFQPTVQTRLAALRRDVAHVELADGIESIYHYFGHHFPDWFRDWEHRLIIENRCPENYVPLPVHPWQADVILKHLCAVSIVEGHLLLLDGPTLDTEPTLSVRTVMPCGDSHAPNLKLSLAVRLTSGVRSITPRSCQMGPRICHLLRKIIAEDKQLQSRVELVDEEVGIHYNPRYDAVDHARYVSAILRRGISSCVATDELAVIGAALPLYSPITGMPLFLEVSGHVLCTLNEALNSFREYVQLLLEIILRFYLVHGISLEAHGQNCLVVFGGAHEVRRILLRDFGGIRIYEPSLMAHGHHLTIHKDRLTIVKCFEELRLNLLHRVYQCHIGHLAYGLSSYFGLAESRFWMEVAGVTEGVLDSLRNEVESYLWLEERAFILDPIWLGKASLRMRLLDRAKDISVKVPNPLLQAFHCCD